MNKVTRKIADEYLRSFAAEYFIKLEHALKCGAVPKGADMGILCKVVLNMTGREFCPKSEKGKALLESLQYLI